MNIQCFSSGRSARSHGIYVSQTTLLHLHRWDPGHCGWQVLKSTRIGQSDVSAATIELDRVQSCGTPQQDIAEWDAWGSRTEPETFGTSQGKGWDPSAHRFLYKNSPSLVCSSITRISWRSGACRTCALISTRSARCHPSVCELCIQRIRSISWSTGGRPSGT